MASFSRHHKLQKIGNNKKIIKYGKKQKNHKIENKKKTRNKKAKIQTI